jgi:hypothetical protein
VKSKSVGLQEVREGGGTQPGRHLELLFRVSAAGEGTRQEQQWPALPSGPPCGRIPALGGAAPPLAPPPLRPRAPGPQVAGAGRFSQAVSAWELLVRLEPGVLRSVSRAGGSHGPGPRGHGRRGSAGNPAPPPPLPAPPAQPLPAGAGQPLPPGGLATPTPVPASARTLRW